MSFASKLGPTDFKEINFDRVKIRRGKRLLLQLCFYGWMSSIAETEAYNETFWGREQVAAILRFLKYNPSVGNHFKRKSQEECASNEDDEDSKEDETKTIFEMKRKSLSRVLLKSEVIKECRERNITNESFGPKLVQDQPRSLNATMEDFMAKVDDLRKAEIYKHPNCYPQCAARGCKWVISFDGLWKLRHTICMWNNRASYPSDILDYVPSVCPDSPKYGHAFCDKHIEASKALNVPTLLNDFIKFCGANPDSLNKDGRTKMSIVLETMSRMSKVRDDKAVDAQGTGYLLRNRNIATKELLRDDKADRNDCRKDIGEKCSHKLCRSRGVFCAISGGGIIRKWDTLFGSEGQTQVGLLITSFVHTYLGQMIPNPEDWRNFFLVYDNMCHIAELKLLQQPLALPEPFDKMWDKEKGVRTKIDPLHIQNHTRPECKVLYDPADVKVNIMIIIIVIVIVIVINHANCCRQYNSHHHNNHS